MRVTLPGLFDLQVNGFGGVDFNGTDLTADRVAEALERIRATGVTCCLPTLITSSFDRFAAHARLVGEISDTAVAGIHMEGPYVSPADGARGAHPLEHVAPATVDDFRRRQDAALGRIVLVTLAPEVPGALTLIDHLVATGVRVAIGHTAATPRQLRDAISAGATLATHLGNGCPEMLPRHPNVIWELLAADSVCASVIADGHHLPASTLKVMVRSKGPERTILVTDAMAAAGCGATVSAGHDATASAGRRFTLGDVVCDLGADGRVSLPGTPYLAGSSLTLDRAIAHTVRVTGFPLETVVRMASTTPAACLGMTPAGSVTADWDPEACDLRVCSVTP
jgi:N-acetylglucosamine-6-phosphate deacetylase